MVQVNVLLDNIIEDHQLSEESLDNDGSGVVETGWVDDFG